MVCAHANLGRIGEFPLDDPENCLYADNVIDFAAARGYHDADGDGRGLAAWAEFVSPTGACHRMPAFFKQAGGKWKLLARFSVEEPGRWRVRWR